MKQKYSEFYLDSGVRRFYDYVENHQDLPDGWRVRTDQWPDPHTNESVYYLVFSNDVYDFEVFLAFKYNFSHAFVANVTPMKVDQLDVFEYNKCLNKFVEDIIFWYETKNLYQTFKYVYRKGVLDEDQDYDKKAVVEASPSKAPAGDIVFSFTADGVGVSVELYAVRLDEIQVDRIVECFDPTNTEKPFMSAKMYDRATITIDTSKTDAFKVVGSDKSAVELLSETDTITGFSFMGSTYISALCTNGGIGYSSSAKVTDGQIELTLS